MENFDAWNNLKKQVACRRVDDVYFYEREIWWIRMGLNLGHEQNGKGEEFERPILIVKKFNSRICIGIPLTTKNKNGRFYILIKDNFGIVRTGIISQIRLFDVSRFSEKIGYANTEDFTVIKKAIRDMF